jgi:hypothetical protein
MPASADSHRRSSASPVAALAAAGLGFLVVLSASAQEPHGELRIECDACHTSEGWKPLREPLRFRHETTGFVLRGAHATTGCRDCHLDLIFSNAGSDCFSCHRADFDAVVVPDHSELPTTCAECHRETAWQPADFLHAQTGFPLEGAHLRAECEDCHTEGYAGTPVDCLACHQADFAGATEPDHQAFPTTCEACHGETAWQPALFDHAQSGFPLVGAHAVLGCEACHADGYAGTPSDCFACHRADFEGATDPDHRSFPTTCEECHGQTSWDAASFDHAQFPLRGAHAAADCEDCHADGYAGTPRDCFSCHQADFEGANDPDHQGFPTTCEECHGETAWQPADFNHNQTGFPLTGSHGGLACLACHQGGYAGTPRDCYACHQDDYQGANDPDHLVAGFPTTCEDCHNTGNWDDANFDHDDLFPIYSGRHRRAWNACEDCHVSPGNFARFECILCHAHQRQQTDHEHNEVRSYVYESQACFRCHPDGRGDD